MRQLFRPLLALLCALSLSSLLSAQSEQRPQILVETTKGNFIIELFNETPVHRDNYLSSSDNMPLTAYSSTASSRTS